MKEIFEWRGRKYILAGQIKLQEGPQTVSVFDVTDVPNLAKFQYSWPEQVFLPLYSPEQVQRAYKYCLLVMPNEGHCSVMTEDGGWCWVRWADLPIRLSVGTKGDCKAVLQKQMDDLDAVGGYGLSCS